MECKVANIVKLFIPDSYWNISRMECKVKYRFCVTYLSFIGIYPEWNVKLR